jgi:hypothetical protein
VTGIKIGGATTHVASRDIRRGTFRLSIVGAALAAAYFGYQDWSAREQNYQRSYELVTTIECGARIVPTMSEEAVKRVVNEHGLIDLGKVGCARRQFFTRDDELRDARNGTMRRELSPAQLITGTSVMAAAGGAIAALFAINLLGFALISARAVARWVGEGFKPTV